MLIGLNGSKGSGKGTVGEYLVENYGFTRLSFADKLKQSAGLLFGLDPVMWDEWKNDPDITVVIKRVAVPLKEMSARYFLQRYGTESHRNVFGDDFWVDALLKDFDPFDGQNYVITDARFANELKRIRQLGGYNVSIRRRRDVSEDSHVSEAPPPPIYIDAWIDNDGTFQRLYNQVDTFVRTFDPYLHKHGSLSKTAN